MRTLLVLVAVGAISAVARAEPSQTDRGTPVDAFPSAASAPSDVPRGDSAAPEPERVAPRLMLQEPSLQASARRGSLGLDLGEFGAGLGASGVLFAAETGLLLLLSSDMDEGFIMGWLLRAMRQIGPGVYPPLGALLWYTGTTWVGLTTLASMMIAAASGVLINRIEGDDSRLQTIIASGMATALVASATAVIAGSMAPTNAEASRRWIAITGAGLALAPLVEVIAQHCIRGESAAKVRVAPMLSNGGAGLGVQVAF